MMNQMNNKIEPKDWKLLKSIQEELIKEYPNLMQNYCNACGIGISPEDKDDRGVGIILYFETKKKLDSFPIKENTYKGYPLYKKKIGKIRPL